MILTDAAATEIHKIATCLAITLKFIINSTIFCSLTDYFTSLTSLLNRTRRIFTMATNFDAVTCLLPCAGHTDSFKFILAQSSA